MADYNAMALMMQMQAQQQAQQALQQGQQQSISALGDAYKTGRTDVTSAIPQQTGALQTGYNTAGQAIQGGLQGSLSALGQGYNTAGGALGTGYNTARSDIAGGVAAFDPYYQTGTQANTAYGNALGLNGAEGNAAATQAFQTSPGYQFAVDQASQNAMRRAGAMGMLGSGNTADALTRLGSNLANQEYGNYLNRLQGLGAQGMQAAGAKYQGAADSANLATNYGGNTAALATDYGKNTANAYDAYGTRGADLATGLGTNLANVYGGSANTLAGLASGYGQNQAQVYQGTAANQANTLMQGSQLAGGILSNQAQQQYANQQKPWLLASGILGGLSGLGAGALSNPGLFR
jgi:hypothetical protein